jgi:multidrug efflux pump
MILLNFVLFGMIPKGFFPEQDTGRLMGGVVADQSISFGSMSDKFRTLMDIIRKDPAIESVAGSVGGGGFGGGSNVGRMFIALKPLGQRKETAQQVIARLRPQIARVPGAQMFLQAVQDIRAGARGGNSLYQYTLQADDLSLLRTWTPRLMEALRNESAVTDLSSDQNDKGLETDLVIDRDAASRLGLTASQIDSTLYDAFGQRQVSTIYHALNQYHVVMEVAPAYWQDPASLAEIYISSSGGSVGGTQSTNAVSGTVSAATSSATSKTSSSTSASSIASDTARNSRLNAIASTGKSSASTGSAVSTTAASMIPLAAFSHYETGTTPNEVNHQGQFAAATISFNLIEGKSLSDAVEAIDRQVANIHMPKTITGSFQGTAKSFQQSANNMILLIIAAIVAIYVVLGVLYESFWHPFTILSTLPSAGLGAFLSLMLFNQEFSLIAWIGVFLLIGIVKKNAIMMIDFALEAERTDGLSPRDAIFKACLLRFRPILMTTMAALLGALPLAIGTGNGAEMRQPLGISIVGGLIVSQLLTLYTTPVVYLYVDKLRYWFTRRPATTNRSYTPASA